MSLPDDDVAFLDGYARTQGFESRSAVVHKAVRLLRAADLGAAYAQAWDEWSDSADADDWDATSADVTSEDGSERR